jgi:hypothetical protein
VATRGERSCGRGRCRRRCTRCSPQAWPGSLQYSAAQFGMPGCTSRIHTPKNCNTSNGPGAKALCQSAIAAELSEVLCEWTSNVCTVQRHWLLGQWHPVTVGARPLVVTCSCTLSQTPEGVKAQPKDGIASVFAEMATVRCRHREYCQML